MVIGCLLDVVLLRMDTGALVGVLQIPTSNPIFVIWRVAATEFGHPKEGQVHQVG